MQNPPHPAVDAYRRLYVAHTAVARAIERDLIRVGVSLPQAIALQVIGTATGAVTATQLAGYMGQERQSMTGLIDRMEMKRWLVRVRDLPDRRAIRLELTDTGREKLDEILPITYHAVVQIFAPFSESELVAMSRTFEAVYDAAAAQPGMDLPSVFESEGQPTADAAIA
ncbi:MAG TPA: MarR family transcriptional regulator [Dehalococcoidia bacterium]|jgi:DNA-binding MarR family transcriptional regulator